MHTKREGKFSSVVKIVFDDVPDDPLARDYATSTREGLLEVGRSPVREGILDHLPSDLKCFDEFSGGVLQEGYHKRGEAMLASYPSKRAMVVCCGSGMEIAHHKLKIPKKDNLCCRIRGGSTLRLFT